MKPLYHESIIVKISRAKNFIYDLENINNIEKGNLKINQIIFPK